MVEGPITKWISSGMRPEDLPEIPNSPDARSRFLSELAEALGALPEADLEDAVGRLPAILRDRIPVAPVVHALDSLVEGTPSSSADLTSVKRILLGELAVDFFILDERWDECVGRLGRLIEMAQELGTPDELAILHNYRGVCFYRLARYPQARSDLEESLRLSREIGSDRGRARASINLGLVLKDMGQLEDAAGHYKLALRLAREIGDNRTLLSCYLNIGNIYKELERWGDGIRALEKGIELADELGEVREAIRGRLNLGVLLLDKGDSEAAAEHFERVIGEAEEVGADQLASTARLNIALALARLGRPAESIRYSEQSLDAAQKSDDPEAVWRSRANLARAHGLLGRITEAEADFAAALDEFDRLRRGLVSDRDRSEFQRNLRSLQTEFIEFTLENRGPEIAFARLARSKGRALLEPLYARIEPVRDRSLVDEELLALIRSRLADRPGTVVLDYFPRRSRLVIFACDEDSVTVHEAETPINDLQELVRELYSELNLFIASAEYRNAMRGKPGGIPQPLRELAEAVLAPVADRIATASRVIFVPQGFLHGIPFWALPDDKGRWLVETHAASVLPASDFIIAGRREKSRKPERIVVLRGGEEGLAEMDREIEDLSEIFGGIVEVADLGVLIDAEGVAGLGRIVADADVVHFAGHAEFDRTDPYSSGLILSGGQRLAARDLLGGEIDLSPAGLVTLAGCETGMVEASWGDEAIGIARAFIAAGARAVLVSLWKVSDEATAELIPAVYRHWLAGLTPDEALRQAILGMLAKAREHPYFFAPFQIVGAL